MLPMEAPLRNSRLVKRLPNARISLFDFDNQKDPPPFQSVKIQLLRITLSLNE
jgi:hypothetical protein